LPCFGAEAWTVPI